MYVGETLNGMKHMIKPAGAGSVWFCSLYRREVVGFVARRFDL